MSTEETAPLLITYLGDAFLAKDQAEGSGEFTKDVLRVGRYVHPLTKQIIDIDDQRLDELEKSTKAYLSVVGSVPFPDGHKWDVMSDLGYWPGPFKRIGDRMFSIVNVTEPAARQKIRNGSIRGVSAVIEFNKTDQSGKTHKQVITQVCATNYPVVTQQSGFVELSALDEISKGATFPADEQGDAFLEALMAATDNAQSKPNIDALAGAFAELAAGDVMKGGEFVGGFDGCVKAQMEKGLPEENAKRLCAFIGRQAGKIP